MGRHVRTSVVLRFHLLAWRVPSPGDVRHRDFVFFLLLCIIPLLKLADSAFQKRGYILQWVIWIGYEYVKTLGFNGHSTALSVTRSGRFHRLSGSHRFSGYGACRLWRCSAWIAGAFQDGCAGRLKPGKGRAFLRRAITATPWQGVCFLTLVYGTVKQQDWTKRTRFRSR